MCARDSNLGTVPHTAIYGFYCFPPDSLKALNYQESNRLACGVPMQRKRFASSRQGTIPSALQRPRVCMRHCISVQLCAVLDKIATGFSNGLYCLTVIEISILVGYIAVLVYEQEHFENNVPL